MGRGLVNHKSQQVNAFSEKIIITVSIIFPFGKYLA
jgi:hypothetical protein